MKFKIKTNNHFRPFIYWNDLSEEEQNFRYGMYEGIEDSTFFRYRGMLNDLNDYIKCESEELKEWDGYQNDTIYSATLIKISDCGDSVKVGMLLS